MTAVDTDIDSFIQQQKAKLANERNILNNNPTRRTKWGPPEPPDLADLALEKEQEMEEYRRTWFELKGKRMEPGSNRKQWGSPVKLSPRGTLDTDHLILEVQKEKEMEEYQEMWKRQHGGQDPSPRGPPRRREEGLKLSPLHVPAAPRPSQPPPEQDEYRRKWQQYHSQGAPGPSNSKPNPASNMPAALDTESIIRQVEKEKRELEDRQNNVLAGGGGGRVNNRAGKVPRDIGSPAPAIDHDNYKRRWEQQNSQRSPRAPLNAPSSKNVPKLDTDALIAEVTAEKLEVENRKLRQERQELEAAKRAGDSLHLQEADSDSAGVLPLGGYEDKRRKLGEERRREYEELRMRQAGHPQQAWDHPRDSGEGVLIRDHRSERSRQLREERNKEYNELLAHKRKLPTPERYGLPREVDEAEDYGLMHSLGARDKLLPRQGDPPASQLNLTGHGLQDNSIRRGYQGRPLREQTDDHKASTIGSNQSDAAKLQKMKERNDEYNQFLASKAEKQAQRRNGDGRQQQGEAASIPGLRYSNSAQLYTKTKREKEDERNREYNEMLRNKAARGQRSQPPAEPKQGWGTPTYEEMLDKKRAQESQYRRANDLEGDVNVREAPREAPRQGNQQDGQYFATLPLGTGPMDEQSRRKEEYKRDLQRQMAEAQLARKTERAQGILVNNNNVVNTQLTSPRLLYSDLNTPRRRQDREIEAYHTKILEGIKGLDNVTPRANANLGRRQPSGDRRNLGGLRLGADAGPAPIGGQGSKGTTVGSGGILDMGFDSLLGGSRVTSLDPPAGLQYQPSTYITANSAPALNTSVDEAYNFYASLNPLDPSLAGGGYWNTSGSISVPIYPCAKMAPQQNSSHGNQDSPGPLCSQCSQNPACRCSCNPKPLTRDRGMRASDLNVSQNRKCQMSVPAGAGQGAGGGGGGGRHNVPSLDLDGVGDDRGRGSRVHFADSRRRAVPASGMDFGTDDDRKKDQRDQQRDYREELERQMVEKNIKKQREKEDKERYEKKMEEEARNYDPFGKGGGGAPMRDQFGNVISADLRQMRNDNLNRDTNPYSPRLALPSSYSPEAGKGGGGGNTTRAGNSYRDDLIGPPPVQTTAEGETSYARGGHGIFGMPKTDAEKTQADRYKAELKKQIEEKKLDDMRKREEKRLEEEREQRILDDQRAKMQREYEIEQEKIRAKEEEARKKNEEMIRAAEEKKLELERRRREADEERQRELREEREQHDRSLSASPPVPATRTKTATPDAQPSRLARPQSSDVLNQLANMRAQLQNERRRVQTMLDDQEDEVEIYDPRQVQRPPPAPVVGNKTEVDVFETALTRNPVAVRRTPADRDRHPDRTAAEEFASLKHKGNSESRKQLRQRYPEEPITDSALEHQQDALLRRQEDQLRGGRDRGALDDRSASRLRRDMRSSSSQLHSNSAFVEVNNLGHFPDDFEDMPKRNDSARYRRRNRLSSSPRVLTPDYNSRATFGSQTSLNVDKLARKNEERLRKLRDLQGDDLSLYDPEDVLDRFMTKQGHNRLYDLEDIHSDTESPRFGTPFS